MAQIETSRYKIIAREVNDRFSILSRQISKKEDMNLYGVQVALLNGSKVEIELSIDDFITVLKSLKKAIK